MTETRKIIRILDSISSISNQQIAIEAIADSDLGFQMWGGKDNAGVVTKWLAKDKAIQVTTATLTDAGTTGSVGIMSHDTNGLVHGQINTLSEINAIITDATLFSETLFDANTILKADSDNTAVALTVGVDTLVGRLSGDVIDDLAVSDVIALLGINLNAAYDVDAGAALIAVDSGSVTWDLDGSNFIVELPTTVESDGFGFKVTHAENLEFFNLLNVDESGEGASRRLNLDGNIYNYDLLVAKDYNLTISDTATIDVSGNLDLTATNLDLATTGTLTLKGTATLATDAAQDLNLTPGAGGTVNLEGSTATIATDAAQDLTFLPGAGGITQVGDAGTTSHTLNTNDDLFCSGMGEFDGVLYADGGITSDGHVRISDNNRLYLGSSDDGVITYRATQTPAAMMIGTSVDSNNLIICEKADIAIDFAFPLQTNPTLCIQSADATSPLQRLYFAHDQTDGIIQTDDGNINFLPATGSITQIGDAGSTSHTLNTNDDLFVSGRGEFDGITYLDGQVFVSQGCLIEDNVGLAFGDSSDARLEYSTFQTNGTIMLGVSPQSNAFIVAEKADVAADIDFALGVQTNPTLCLQSADATSPLQRLYFAHNQTDGIIQTDAGNINFLPATGSITQIGDAGTTSHTLNTNDDLFCSGRGEFDGDLYADGNIHAPDGSNIYLGDLDDAVIQWGVAQGPDNLVIGLGTQDGLIICEKADIATNFGLAGQTNPTLCIQSADATTPAQRVYTSHNQVNAFKGIGTGGQVTYHDIPVSLADDAGFDLPDGTQGFGFLIVEDNEEWAQFSWSSDGTPILISSSSNVVTTDTDTKFCIFDNGSVVRVRNRLGAVKNVMFDYHYSTVSTP